MERIGIHRTFRVLKQQQELVGMVKILNVKTLKMARQKTIELDQNLSEIEKTAMIAQAAELVLKVAMLTGAEFEVVLNMVSGMTEYYFKNATLIEIPKVSF